jgi:hypothetical protein
MVEKSSNSCCICDPTLPINPHVCPAHKTEGRKLAAANGTRFIDAASDLYFRAKEFAAKAEAAR